MTHYLPNISSPRSLYLCGKYLVNIDMTEIRANQKF
jgi:hypothetical protein